MHAQSPLRRLAFFGHDARESTIIKRVETFRLHGCHVHTFMFARERFANANWRTWDHVHLGYTVDRNYLKRLPKLLTGLLKTIPRLGTLRNVDAIYARNIDMLLVAFAAKALSRSRAPLAYEVLDVQRVFLGDRIVNRVFRAIERLLLKRTAVLVVSSPDFMTCYFHPVQGYRGDWYLLENKIAAKQLETVDRPSAESLKPPGPPWVIGWFGTLRCTRSLEILCTLADRLGDRVQIYMRGRPSEEDLPLAVLQEAVRSRTNMAFEGTYKNPADLADIYGRVHFSWCVDFLDDGSNSTWLLPNRLYEGGFFGTVALACAGTATGRMVEEKGLGIVLEQPLADTVAECLERIGETAYAASRRRVENLPRSIFLDETDTLGLMRRLAGRIAEGQVEAGEPVGNERATLK
jgi:succinoglycan biosynthesis protein ExoL